MFRDLHDAALALWGPIVEGGHPRPTGATCARCAQEERALLFYAAALPEGSASERLMRAVQEAPWTDRPALDSAVLARAVRELNDWTGFVDDAERDEVLRPWLLAPASAGSPDRDRALALALVNDAVRVVAPSALDAAGLCSHAEALRALAPVRDGATALIAAAVAAKASAVPVPDGLSALERRRITGARADRKSTRLNSSH